MCIRDRYYSDFNFELSKKFSRTVSITFEYYNQIYNQQVVEGHAINNPLVYSNIFCLLYTSRCV